MGSLLLYFSSCCEIERSESKDLIQSILRALAGLTNQRFANQVGSLCSFSPLSSSSEFRSCVKVEVADPGLSVLPNEPSGFHGRKAILNHAHALVSACP